MSARPLAIATLLATSAPCQLGAHLPIPDNTGSHKHRLDVQGIAKALTGRDYTACLGVAYDEVAGRYYVSARRTIRQSSHVLLSFWYDRSAQRWQMREVSQPPATDKSEWGLRDLCFSADHGGVIYGSCESDVSGHRVFAYRPSANSGTGAWDPTLEWRVPRVANPVTTLRALAHNPDAKTMWTADFGSRVAEFDASGRLLGTYAEVQESTFGAAYDPVRKTIWWFGQRIAENDTASGVVGTEMWASGPNKGMPTGNRFSGDRDIAGEFPGGLAGGIDFYVRNGTPVVVYLTQARSDTLVEIYGRFNYGRASDGDLTMNYDPAHPSRGLPIRGRSQFGFTLRGSSADLALFYLAPAKTAIPLVGSIFAPGTTLYVSGRIRMLTLPVQRSGPTELPLPIPNSSGLEGVNLWWQVIGVHTSGPFTFSTTGGGETKIY